MFLILLVLSVLMYMLITYLKPKKIVKTFKSGVVYLVHPQNKGGSAARNTGWKNSKGEYITFLDDDDEIDITKIEITITGIKLFAAFSSPFMPFCKIK